MAPLKVREEMEGWERGRWLELPGGLAGWLAGWLAAAIYGSRHRGVYFCLPVSLETTRGAASQWDIVFHIGSCFAWKGDSVCLFLQGGSLISAWSGRCIKRCCFAIGALPGSISTARGGILKCAVSVSLPLEKHYLRPLLLLTFCLKKINK